MMGLNQMKFYEHDPELKNLFNDWAQMNEEI